MTGLATAYFCINYMNCTAVDGWKMSTKLKTVGTQVHRIGATECYSGTVCCAVE